MTGDWLLLQELLERGDPGFVDRLRGVTDADALGRFAERWYANPSPEARRLLLEYLERPLNTYRHEALVKRLFKRAEAAGDDAVMARFLVAFDRSIRRVQRVRHRLEKRPVRSREEGLRIAASWRSQGYGWTAVWPIAPGSRSLQVVGSWPEPYLATPEGTTIGRDQGAGIDPGLLALMIRWFAMPQPRDEKVLSARQRKRLERLRLFSVPTRQYLRRRGGDTSAGWGRRSRSVTSA